MVEQIIGDNEFECIKEDVTPIILNITAAGENESTVERSIRIIKERTRCQIQYLSYARYPRVMVIGCIIFSTKALNNEVEMSKLSKDISPSALITGRPDMNYKEIVSSTFGEYVDVYTASNAISDNNKRITSTVTLYLSSNLQGGWMFISRNSGRVLHRHQWKKISTNQKIINRVEEPAIKERQPYVSSNFKY